MASEHIACLCVPLCLQALIAKMNQQQPNNYFLSQQVILEYQFYTQCYASLFASTTQQLKALSPIFRKIVDLLGSEGHQMEFRGSVLWGENQWVCNERTWLWDLAQPFTSLVTLKLKVKVSCTVVSNSLWFHGLQPVLLPRPWNSPSKSAGVGCCFLLQRISPTWGSNPGLPHCRKILYQLSH